MGFQTGGIPKIEVAKDRLKTRFDFESLLKSDDLESMRSGSKILIIFKNKNGRSGAILKRMDWFLRKEKNWIYG